MALIGTSTTYELSDSTVIDGVIPCSYWAKIIDTSPEDFEMGRNIHDYDAYMAHRKQINIDQAAFEDKFFALKDKILEDKNGITK